MIITKAKKNKKLIHCMVCKRNIELIYKDGKLNFYTADGEIDTCYSFKPVYGLPSADR